VRKGQVAIRPIRACRRLHGKARDEPTVQSVHNSGDAPENWCASRRLTTGVVRAYLAWCSEKERNEILERLRKLNRPGDGLARDPKRFDKILGETRRRGYATRDPSFVPVTDGGAPFPDGAAAIAVALSDGTRVHGSISLDQVGVHGRRLRRPPTLPISKPQRVRS
jgi:hypothetical protein